MMEQRAPKIQSEVVYQRKKKTIYDGIEGTKDLVRSRISKKEKDKTSYQRSMESKKGQDTKDLVRSRISKKEKDKT